MALDHLTRAATHLATQFTDDCIIRNPDVTLGALNATTGLYDSPTVGATVYTGPCIVSQSPHQGGTLPQAGQDWILESHRLRIPATATTPSLGDIVTVTASVRDPDMVGLELEVVGPRQATYLVSKIIGCRSVERSPVVP